jgi:hypothetical protein
MLNCEGEVIEIDDNIFDTILLLNQKDYPTKFCCSGHTWGGDPYIYFEDLVKEKSFVDLPKNFTADTIRDGRFTIRKSVVGKSIIERMNSLSESAIDLFTWADQLTQSCFLAINFDLDINSDHDAFAKKLLSQFNLSSFEQSTTDNSKFISIDMIISPKKSTRLNAELKIFANANGAKVNIERF